MAIWLQVTMKDGTPVGKMRWVSGPTDLTLQGAIDYLSHQVVGELARGRFEGALHSQCLEMKRNGFEIVPATPERVAEAEAKVAHMNAQMAGIRRSLRGR